MEVGKPLVTGHAADRTRISHRIDISPDLQQGRVSVLSGSMAIRCIERVAGYVPCWRLEYYKRTSVVRLMFGCGGVPPPCVGVFETSPGAPWYVISGQKTAADTATRRAVWLRLFD